MQISNDLSRLSPAIVTGVDGYREAFVGAWPFKHIMIEGFFTAEFAERLLQEFPSFDKRKAISEAGTVGGKSVHTKISEISPSYQELYAFISSAPFLEYMSALSGIPELILDPKMYGGGTHENLHGQELDAHIDFNYDESRQLHRRLNLIVYLNHGWQSEWGGAIEIHSNPRQPEENRIAGFDPLFNRAVMFETNEVSWHGFPKISLPENLRETSRKSISIYLYTKDRPQEEIVPMHGTFYVQRPLPQRFQEGYMLAAEDVSDLRRLLTRRDHWVQFYQRMELELNGRIDRLEQNVRKPDGGAPIPLSGYVRTKGETQGMYEDGWTALEMAATLKPSVPVTGMTFSAYRPPEAGPGELRVLIDGVEAARLDSAGGKFDLAVPVAREAGQSFVLETRFHPASPWQPSGESRELAFVLEELRSVHPFLSLWKNS